MYRLCGGRAFRQRGTKSAKALEQEVDECSSGRVGRWAHIAFYYKDVWGYLMKLLSSPKETKDIQLPYRWWDQLEVRAILLFVTMPFRRCHFIKSKSHLRVLGFLLFNWIYFQICSPQAIKVQWYIREKLSITHSLLTAWHVFFCISFQPHMGGIDVVCFFLQ